MNVLVSEMQRIAPDVSKRIAVIYILRLKSGSIYIGISTDLEQRLDDHISGQACRTTLLDPPATLVRVEIYTTYTEARKREVQLKRCSRAKKEALVLGNLDSLRLLSQSASSDQVINSHLVVSCRCESLPGQRLTVVGFFMSVHGN